MLIVVLLISAPNTFAQHVNLPPVNLGDTNFLDGVAGPGLLIEQIGEFQRENEITDANGDASPGASVHSDTELIHVAYLSKYKLLGGFFGGEVVVPVASVRVATERTHPSTLGLGDINIGFVNLQWNQKLWRKPFSHRLDLNGNFPVGNYSRNNAVNSGTNLWTFNPYYAFTIQPTKRSETSWRFYYLLPGSNREPAPDFAANSTRPGQAVHFNGAASYEVGHGLRLGASGYYLKQISDGRIGIMRDTTREQVAAIGPGLVWINETFFVYVNSYLEFAAQNRPKGVRLVVRLAKVFPHDH